MLNHLVRRAVYSLLVLFGVNLLVFILFFAVNTPDDMARQQLGGKRVSAEAITQWKVERGYDKPYFFNDQQRGFRAITQTLFFQTSWRLARLDFGATNEGRDIAYEVRQRLAPTIAIATPVFLLTIAASIVFALALVLFRHTAIDGIGVLALVGLMSISSLFFIILGQYLFSTVLRWMPLSGYTPGSAMFSFIVLPIAVMVLARIGPDARLYRAIFLEELSKDYVRSARARGLGETKVLIRHVLRNALIPIITSSGLLLPTVFVGAIVTETFFAIPGLGSFTIEGITQQDFNIVRAMVFIGSVLYVLAFLLTDLAYSWADPRVRLQ